MIGLPAVTALNPVGIVATLETRRGPDAQAGGTPVVRADGMACRALEEAATIAAFALWNGPGM